MREGGRGSDKGEREEEPSACLEGLREALHLLQRSLRSLEPILIRPQKVLKRAVRSSMRSRTLLVAC